MSNRIGSNALNMAILIAWYTVAVLGFILAATTVLVALIAPIVIIFNLFKWAIL